MIFQLLRLKKIKKSGAKHIELSSERSFVKYSFYHPEYFHEFYFQLKKNVEKYFKRIYSYNSNAKRRIFLVEYMEEFALSMAEKVNDESNEKLEILYYLQRDKKY